MRSARSAFVAALLVACSHAGEAPPIASEPPPAPIASRSPEPPPPATAPPVTPARGPEDGPPGAALASPARGDLATTSTADAAESVRAAQSALAPFGTTLGAPPDVFEIPAAARPAFSILEQAFLRYLLAALPPSLARNPSDDLGLSKALVEPLARAGVARGFEAQSFGSLLALSARRHPGGWLGLVVTTSLDCGSDDTLFLFSTTGAAPRHVLTAAARQRTTLADGQLGLDYALVPSASGADPEVVVSSATPWCSSAWRTLRYDVLAPAADPAAPHRLLSREDSVWIGNRIGSVDAGADWFQLSYDSWDRVGTDVGSTRLERYERRGNGWQRAAPLVGDADLVVRAWANLPPGLAKELVRAEARASAAKLHARFARATDQERATLVTETLDPSRARTTATCEDCKVLPTTITFSLTRDGGRWAIAGVRSRG